jgi:peptide/nickel transport system permease protein
MVIAGVLGLLVGVTAAVKRRTKIDYLLSTLSFFGLSFPTFFLGLLLLLLFAVKLGWFPLLGIGGESIDMFRRPISSLRVLFLPALTIGLINAATISRMVRASLLETLRQPYTLAARARGSFESVITVRHGLRNALIPTIAVLGLTFGQLLGGMVIVEQVFTLPGVGRALVDAVRQRDYPVVQVTVLFFAFAFAFVNMLTDTLYTVADPRVRLEA